MKRETIICVTPNAALDRTLVAPDFAIGHISRIPNAIAVPGGKGLNVLRAARLLGGRPLAMGLLGGHTGRTIAALVAADGYEAEWTRFNGETRTCTIIAGPEGESTVINEAGRIEPDDWRALVNDICRVAAREDIGAVCLCGSLPTGAPESAPADLVEGMREIGAPIWVDSSKRWLANAIAAKPYAIKVNRDEIVEALGAEAKTERDIVRLARGLVAAGSKIIVISMGADGALLVTRDLYAKAKPPTIKPIDPVASGDCLHAGIVTALAAGVELPEALRRGVAAGTVNALYAGGAQFSHEHFLDILAQTQVVVSRE